MTVPGGYRLTVDRQAIDLTRFEGLVASADAALEKGDPQRATAAYTEALELWRGDVLADLSDYDFVAHLRTRLDELRASALESRIQAELDLGHHLAAISELGGLIAEHPLREGLHAQRILALYRSGRQSDALAAYRELCTVLDTELGIEPSPPLRELHTRVLGRTPTLAWHRPGAPEDAADPTAPPLPRVPVPSPVASVGRIGQGPAAADVGSAPWRRCSCVVAALTGSATIQVLDAPAATAAMLPTASARSTRRDLSWPPCRSAQPDRRRQRGGAIWVVNASDDTVSRVDPSTHSVRQDIDVGHDPRVPGRHRGLPVGHQLRRRDGHPDQHPEQPLLSGRSHVGSGPDAIAAGPAGLWVANSGDNTIQRIDPASGVAGAPVDVGDGPDGLAVDDTSVWVANGRAGSVMRFNASSREPMVSPDHGGQRSAGHRPGRRRRLGGRRAVPGRHPDRHGHRGHRVDGCRGRTDRRRRPRGVDLGGRQVRRQLVRINARAPHEQTRFPVGVAAHGMAVVDGHLWVAAGALPAASHRGGTLRVAASSLPGTWSGIDPARVYDPATPPSGADRLRRPPLGQLHQRPTLSCWSPTWPPRCPSPSTAGGPTSST